MLCRGLDPSKPTVWVSREVAGRIGAWRPWVSIRPAILSQKQHLWSAVGARRNAIIQHESWARRLFLVSVLMPLTLRSVAGFQASVVPLNTPHSSHKPFKEMGRRTSSRLKSQVATAHSAVSSDEPKAPLARPRARSQKKAPAAAEPTKAAGAGKTSAGATPKKGAQTRVKTLEAATRKRKINQDKDCGDQNESVENPTGDKTKQQKKNKPVKEKTVKEKVAKVIFGCHECQQYYPCPLRWPRLVGQIAAKLSGLSAKDVCLWRALL